MSVQDFVLPLLDIIKPQYAIALGTQAYSNLSTKGLSTEELEKHHQVLRKQNHNRPSKLYTHALTLDDNFKALLIQVRHPAYPRFFTPQKPAERELLVWQHLRKIIS